MVAAGLALAFAVPGCSTLGATEDESRGPDLESDPRQALDLGTGVVLDAPASWEIRRPFAPSVESTGCTVQAASVDTGPDMLDVEVLLVGVGCTESHEGLNGSRPDFVRADLVPDARDVIEETVSLGELTLFGEPYVECGGECTESVRRVALIEMTNPPERDFPTLVVYASPDPLDDTDLRTIVDGITLDQP